MERKLLDFFRGEERPVPFAFGNYYPDDFLPAIPLARFISAQFKNSRGEDIAPHLPEIRDRELSAVLADL
jgi:hypothetical protein